MNNFKNLYSEKAVEKAIEKETDPIRLTFLRNLFFAFGEFERLKCARYANENMLDTIKHNISNAQEIAERYLS